MKVTYINNGSKIYLKVNKCDILTIGLNPDCISGYSGMNLYNVYLDPEHDLNKFLDLAKRKNIKLEIFSDHNPNFATTNNYNAKLFNFRIALRQRLILFDEKEYTVIEKHPKIILVDKNGFKVNLPRLFMFSYIKKELK